MPHPIVEISELTQVIADNLLLDGKRGLVSLACTCRALEEQALSTLWSEQPSLRTLVKSTLPPEILSDDQPPPQPTNAEWDKFRRYGSWMRQLDLDWESKVPEATLRMISLNLPSGTICPGLRELSWRAYPFDLPFHRLFLSPALTKLSFTCSSRNPEVLSRLPQVILELNTFSLQSFQLQWNIPEGASQEMESVTSSAVLRCGPDLKALSVLAPLSDAAVQHIMQLPNLVWWSARRGPPKTSDLSQIGIFPRLKVLELQGTLASLEWLPLLGESARRAPTEQQSFSRDLTPALTVLDSSVAAPIDMTLMSSILPLHRLVILDLETSCSDTDGCTFGLTDDNVAEITTALSNLHYARFGRVCHSDSCKATVSSLLFLSVRCKNLGTLEIHFNTGNLRDDLKSIPENPQLRNLCALPRCQLGSLRVSLAPLRSEEYEELARGFHFIFPSLRGIAGVHSGWAGVSSRLSNRA